MKSLLVEWAVGIAVAAALVFVGLHWYDGRIDAARADGATAERAVWVEKDRVREGAEKQAVIERAQEAFAKQAANAAINLKVEDDHAQAVKALNTRIAALDAESRSYGGLRIDRAVCDAANGGGLLAGTPTAGDGKYDAWIAGTVALPAELESSLRAKMNEADAIVEDYRTTQQWIREHGFYGPVTVAP